MMSALSVLLLLPRVVRLAQTHSSKRSRIYGQLSYGDAHARTLTDTVSRLRVAAYRQRLSELGNSIGRGIEPPPTLDMGLVRGLARDSSRAAAGIVKSHNRDLRAFLAAQDRGLSQADLGKAARAWERQRVSQKSKQIAQNEAARARAQALTDVLRRNRVRLKVRAVPEEAAEEQCVDLVGRGWIDSDGAPELPLHVNCVHEYEDAGLGDALAGRSRIWLGGMVDGSAGADEEGEVA